MRKTAMYPGSFDPFTNGHLDIVKKAAELFEVVYIVIGVNSSKRRAFPADTMKTAIEKALEENRITNCVVCGITWTTTTRKTLPKSISSLTPIWSISTSVRKMWQFPPLWSRNCICTARTFPNMSPRQYWKLWNKAYLLQSRYAAMIALRQVENEPYNSVTT